MSDDPEHVDVVIVGGGPAGASAAVFTARYGLDTLVFDRGNAALDRCGYLENYLGFPAGVEIETFQKLIAAHVREAGAERREELVESVTRVDGDASFRIETQQGTTVGAEVVVAAAWYDGSYLWGLDEPSMFEEHEHHGDLEERFDPDYADSDGRTPIDGLYVASPAGARSAQAIVAAGNGAHVARTLIEDRRRERGLSGEVAPEYDWVRPESEYAGEWADRERWVEWFDTEIDSEELSEEHLAELRETYVDRAFETRVTESEVDERAARGRERLVEVVGAEALLDAMDEETIREYVDERTAEEAPVADGE
ncbi:FAD-dependent oxidoreductase [Halapricum salinum]|uniref:FAD-binding protein n=1 Tax=Halapricum salinum TaxID=1457250 RepID=A0A4D6HDJ4_9EURY|nr:FAD-dependent oxidoreductase [Halapricum salinum]QCC52043.1 FAD-binding protein [Halapricum salinum]